MVPDGVPRPLRSAVGKLIGGLTRRGSVPGPIAARIAADTTPITSLPFAWDASYPARVGVMPRDGGADDVRWFDIDPCYVFHTLNAYEDGTDSEFQAALFENMYEDQIIHTVMWPAIGVLMAAMPKSERQAI